jgi:hypothetical protein
MYAELMRNKTCTMCRKEKPVSEYYKRTISPDGFGVYCKKCDNHKSNEYRSKFREQVSAVQKTLEYLIKHKN